MAVTLGNNQITSSSGNLGINKSNPTTPLDVNGSVNASGGLAGDGANLTGIIKGWTYYTNNNADLGIGGTAKTARTIASGAPAGDYLVMFNLNWLDGVAPNSDEDAAEFYITASNGTVNSTRAQSREINLNGGTNQRGFQGMTGLATVNLTSTGDIRLFFNNLDGDTDAGGFGGHCSTLVLRRDT